jgi:hypothetical protein
VGAGDRHERGEKLDRPGAALGASVRRVQAALDAVGAGHTVAALTEPARTSAEAARAVGCRVDQIAK